MSGRPTRLLRGTPRLAVLTLMILARTPLLFDRWGAPWPLMLLFGVSGLYAILCAFHLRHIAERARRTATGRLGDLLIRAKGDPDLGPLAAQIEVILRSTENLRQGTFARFSDQPAMRALLLPLGSSTGLALLGYLGWGG